MHSYTIFENKMNKKIVINFINNLPKKVIEKISINYFNNSPNNIYKYYSVIIFDKDFNVIDYNIYKDFGILVKENFEKESLNIFNKHKDKDIVVVYIHGNFKKLKYLPIEDNFNFYTLMVILSFVIESNSDISEFIKKYTNS